MPKLTKIPISSYQSVRDIKGIACDLRPLLEDMKNDTYADQIRAVRTGKAEKNTLPAFTPSGLFNGTRSIAGLKQPSGLICLDFDKVKDIDRAKEFLAVDPHVFVAGISAGGQGLFCIVDAEITGDKDLKDKFPTLTEYFLREYGLEADESCKDICRLRFVTHDPDLYINPEAKTFPVPITETWEDVTPPAVGWRYADILRYAGICLKAALPISAPLNIAQAWETYRHPDSTTDKEKAIEAVRNVYRSYTPGEPAEDIVSRAMKLRITPETDVPPKIPMITVYGYPVLYRGKGHLIHGKQKARKTSLILKMLTGGENIEVNIPGRICWLDLEQDAADGKRIVDILHELKLSDEVDYFHLRSLRPHEVEQLMKQMDFSEYDLLILDTARDMVRDFNDLTASREGAKLLMDIMDGYECAVLSVLHENKKDGYSVGHLGLELERDFELTSKIEKKDGKHSVWSFEHSRHTAEIPDFALTRNASDTGYDLLPLDANFREQADRDGLKKLHDLLFPEGRESYPSVEAFLQGCMSVQNVSKRTAETRLKSLEITGFVEKVNCGRQTQVKTIYRK